MMPDLAESFRQFASLVILVLLLLVAVSNGPTEPPSSAAPSAYASPACRPAHPFAYLPEDHFEETHYDQRPPAE